jgi:hypothetical protein
MCKRNVIPLTAVFDEGDFLLRNSPRHRIDGGGFFALRHYSTYRSDIVVFKRRLWPTPRAPLTVRERKTSCALSPSLPGCYAAGRRATAPAAGQMLRCNVAFTEP